MKNVLVIGDLHAPWMHPKAIPFLSCLKKLHKPDLVVCIGDEIDAASWSRYAKNPHMPSPVDELRMAKKALQPLYKLFPKVLVCRSNHPARLNKQARNAGLTDDMLQDENTLLGAPVGWERAKRHVVNGVLYMHGDGYSGREGHVKAAIANRRSVVMGHLHPSAGVAHLTGLYDRIWAMNVGCLIDPSAPAFDYADDYAARPTLGAGVILAGVPHFIPLE